MDYEIYLRLNRLVDDVMLRVWLRDTTVFLGDNTESHISKEFLSLDPDYHVKVCGEIQTPALRRKPFPLHSLPYSLVLRLYKGLDRLKFRYQNNTLFVGEQLHLSKLALEAKAILLLSYHYGFNHSQLINILLTDVVVAEGKVALSTMQSINRRPLGELEEIYTATIANWRRICRYEDMNKYLFPSIQPDRFQNGVGIHLNQVVRFIFYASPAFLIEYERM